MINQLQNFISQFITGRLRIGIGQKIYLSIGALVLIAAGMAVSNYTMIGQISKTTSRLVNESLPQILLGSQLDKKVINFVNHVYALQNAEDEERATFLKGETLHDLKGIENILSDMTLTDEVRSRLSDLTQELNRFIPILYGNAAFGLNLKDELIESVMDAEQLKQDILILAAPLYDDADFNLMISLSDLGSLGKVIKRSDAGKVASQGQGAGQPVSTLPYTDMAEFSTDFEDNISALSVSLRLIAEINTVGGYYAEAGQLDDVALLVPMKEKFNAAQARVERQLKQVNHDDLKASVEEFLEYGRGSGSLFDAAADVIDAEHSSNETAQRLNKILSQVSETISDEIIKIEEATKDKSEHAIDTAQSVLSSVVILTSVMILVAVGLSFFYVRPFIVNRLIDIYRSTEAIASGDLDVDVKSSGSDELARMGAALLDFRDNARERIALEEQHKENEARQREERRAAMLSLADDFEGQVGEIVGIVVAAAQQMQSMSVQLNATIASASEKSESVAQSSSQASGNVHAVAAATEEMNASISEISGNLSRTSQTSKLCSDAAQASQTKLDQLSNAVDEIDAVIQSINDVAEQTNLLALNATIEAARAGEAGKGFAVVANEVKALAGQTHNMTDDISKKVVHIKDSTMQTVETVRDIINQISMVDSQTASVAAAVEEQSASASEMSRNILEASRGTESVSSDIQDVQHAATESASATQQFKAEADNLANQVDRLNQAVESFLSEVRS